ncbi:DNA cytosine methyltransferase [Crassaminicella profunda]|uniref:DNA cytosine methyltransferase n=1 Tax=Crassaminicella profunda TaxID=1286698 RepID=UPI001CA686E5|nr:DNA cytosine methyltransferase [Crassaminicella profunda]QZY56484.1 DNA cytosine methyltransferase [Crassaminicella profunda]
MDKPVVLDIFCGAGGMSEGFIQAGFDVGFACDINKQAMDTYVNRHKQLGYNVKFACVDIKKFSEEEFLKEFLGEKKVDVVCGGPPCQGFSLAGKRKQDDPRNMLFKSYIQTIKNVKPSYFVMENVEGLLSMKFDKFKGISGKNYKEATVPQILEEEFYKIGYKVEHKVLQANGYGVPQNRKRVFFIGHKIEKIRGKKYVDLVVPPKFPMRSVSKDVTIKLAIDDLSFLEAGHHTKKYHQNQSLSDYQSTSINGRTPAADGNPIKAELLSNHEATRHSAKVIERFSLIPEGGNLEDLKKRLSNDEWEKYKTKKLRCYRVKSDEPSPTVLTLPDDLIHYARNRIMTVRELARLQSFDDSFVFLGKRTTGGKKRKVELPQYTQVGNAVPPLMARAVAKEIMKAFIKSV